MASISVYVGGLGDDVKKKDLEREFRRFGNITRVWIASHPPGYAFIDFQNDNDAKEAINKMNGAIFNTTKIRVDKSHSRCKKGRGRSGRVGGFHGSLGGRGGFGEGQKDSFDSGIRHKETKVLLGGPCYDVKWTPVETFDCALLDQTYKYSSMCESSCKKRVLFDSENISCRAVKKQKACVEESNDTIININSLPEEILIKIFCYLKLNELGHIARVCKWWHKIASYPVLWKKISVVFQEFESPNERVLCISENLPMCLTHLKLDFQTVFNKDYTKKEPLDFVKICATLGRRCPFLKALILHNASFSINLQSVIDLCILYVQNLEILSIRLSCFTTYSFKTEYDGNHCKIRLLDLFGNSGEEHYNIVTFSKVSSLKKLSLPGFDIHNSWFGGDTSFLNNLEVLDLRGKLHDEARRIFQTLKNHALKLTELYLCNNNLMDSDFRFSKSAFPQLKTLCLKQCPFVTCETLIYIISSWKSLQNVYVDYGMVKLYAQHPFVLANKYKLEIVKTTGGFCNHCKKYLFK